MQYLRNFSEICRGDNNILHFVNLLLFFVCENDISTFTKAAAVVINNYLSSTANCVNFFFLTCNEMSNEYFVLK